MTEYAGKLDEEMTSSIIISTCQLIPKSFSHVSDHMHNLIPSNSPSPQEYSIMCGSMAEFYIRPLNTCITDTDYLISSADQLVFSGNELDFNGDYSVLPSDLSGLADAMECYKIESYKRYPGFVRLRILGGIVYNWECKKYEFFHARTPNYFIRADLAKAANNFYYTNCKTNYPILSTHPTIVSGPAISSKDQSRGIDAVLSMWCPKWPIEVKDWPIRPRYQGWPTPDTISQVVLNGCHVVYIQHRSCRYDKEQWRLSFSIAELILLQSWTKVQQLVYHLMRFFAKRELVQKYYPKDSIVLCMYHLKTLMLWTCEEMSPEWWISHSVIAICCELLQKLSEWLRRRFCSNYFIPEANLFHDQWSSAMVENTERQLNTWCNCEVLCHWFLENYIMPVARKHFKVNWVTPIQQTFLMTLFEYRKKNVSNALDIMLSQRFGNSRLIYRLISKIGATTGVRWRIKHGYDAPTQHLNICGTICIHAFLPKLSKISCFRHMNNLQCILTIAYLLGCGMLSWDCSFFVEFVKAVSMQPKFAMSKYHNFPKCEAEQSTRFRFLRALDLIQNLTGSNSPSEFQLVFLTSGEFFRKALRNVKPNCHQCNCIASATLAYLAALHFANSEYEKALRYSVAVLVDQTSQRCDETLSAGSLVFIDDIAKIVGLCVLCNNFKEGNLQNIGKRAYLDLRLSADVFAHYLTVSSADRISQHLEFYHCVPDSIFPMDDYLNNLVRPKYIALKTLSIRFNSVRLIVYRRSNSLPELESGRSTRLSVTTGLIGVLMKYALENMTSCYSAIRKDFGIQCNTDDCYRALYLYKCRQYDDVLCLCERILREPDLPTNLQQYGFAMVLLVPPLDSFFDKDIQSLLGFHTLIYYLSPANEILLKFVLPDKPSSFAHWFAKQVYLRKDELSKSLDNYSINWYYSLGRRFLAIYLKTRCCIDCNLPHTEGILDIAALKSYLPFERIIYTFLLESLRVTKNRSRVLPHQ